ncbi:von Willebrand factor A domain-containing protein 8-like [Antedon mediterranea]|uniref:von Willebrand factor A domain-containing protein 8-like n=1 Tax=Antedon mediterranea TaxID=105859 RepID=UPI003AF4510D
MSAIIRMSAVENSIRRIKHLQLVLTSNRCSPSIVLCHTDSRITIGGVSRAVKNPNSPQLVPINYVGKNIPQSVLQHLRWIMQKDLLGQDVFLIGPPGHLRRAIAMSYLELTKREVEYISLTRDTTETDLKQRREIQEGNAFYIDQCAVRAAMEGRVLVLEGIEKAERNVLPVLNNLLENREMQLEDGRFLVAADRYDKLLEDHTKEELESWKLVRVNENFRVIALGLPVPRYHGNPLDPPLRSRFQARDVNPLTFKDHLDVLRESSPNLQSDKASQMLSFATTLISKESTSLGLPDFPMDNLLSVIKILNSVPNASVQNVLEKLYPFHVMLAKEGRTAVVDMLKKFELLEDKYGNLTPCSISNIQYMTNEDNADVTIQSRGAKFNVNMARGNQSPSSPDSMDYISVPSHEHVLADMMLSHSVKDFCLIGPKGCGKSLLVKRFASMLGYQLELVMLYQDMTSRDFLQQRMTSPNGDTSWRLSPLITAAVDGSIAVLDGLHRVNPGTLAVLNRLVHDREVTLFDGTRLIGHDRYEELKQKHDLTDTELKQCGILPIHHSFRIIGLAEPPSIGGSSGQQWLSSEILTMFLFHQVKPLSFKEEMTVLHGIVPGFHEASLEQLLNFSHRLRNATDPTLQSLSSSLSTRNLVRIARRLSTHPNDCLHYAVNKANLSRFLPQLAHQALDKALEDAGMHPRPTDIDMKTAISCEVTNNIVRIGTTTIPVSSPDNQMMVPDTLFYENSQHLSIMEDMLKDFLLGEHLLLIGNQGVGKNKVIDRFLHLLNKPRQYIQLHRDTTVQSLTLQPNVQGGVIIYEDSPLVKAVKLGHVLVIDEADKAPTNVTCILKSLVENGEMVLADGRKIVASGSHIQPSENVIVTHPNFRMVVLANRPGFPFLGNDFFGSLGDIFSCHAVDNPDMESEMAMLKKYGPSVPDTILKKLVLAFGELRSMADQGLISYPYSTREVVNMVKHLEKFPNEGIANVVKNVFDFDVYNQEVQEQLIDTLHKHGIPIGAQPTNVQLAKELPLPAIILSSHWKYDNFRSSDRKMLCPVEEKNIKVKGPVQLGVRCLPMERTEARSLGFGEEVARWVIPLDEHNIITDVAVTKDKAAESIHLVTCSPVGLYSMHSAGTTMNFLDLYDVFPGLSRKMVRIAALGHPLLGQIVMHEEQGNVVLVIDTTNGSIQRLYLTSMYEEAKKKFTQRFTGTDQENFKMCSHLAHENCLVFYQESGILYVVNILEGSAYSVDVPVHIKSLHLSSKDSWLIEDATDNRKYLLTRPSPKEPVCQLHSITTEKIKGPQLHSEQCITISNEGLAKEGLASALGQEIESPNRVFADSSNIASIAVGFPDLKSTVDIYTFPRSIVQPLKNASSEATSPLNGLVRKTTVTIAPSNIIQVLPMSAQVVRITPSDKVPKEALPSNDISKSVSNYLEVADLSRHTVKYIPVPRPTRVSQYVSWFSGGANNITMASTTNDGIVTIDAGGIVRLWETSGLKLMNSLKEWKNMIGSEDGRPLQINYEKEVGKGVTSPKHGKEDPTNEPHVGGNTWAGGTGGRDTAGLGGIGGPYRLDAGHDVTQVSQAEKDAVPPEVLLAAREMAQKAFKEKLAEINMSEYDAGMYDKFLSNVKRQVQSIRVILESLQAKNKERQWLKHQTSGDLDDSKLIEGLTGERNIYKRRKEKEPEPGAPQVLPKRLRLVVDVSGSMYRFNGVDQRLERVMEAAVMVMESFEKYEIKFKYDIVGHSGENYNIPFVKGDKSPANNNDRLKVIKTMYAHSQFCMSGDYTLEATQFAINDITKTEADEYFVIVLSDANFDRYGISPSHFGRVLNSNEDVNSFAIFIGSLGDQADRLVKNLPAGRAFVCLDTKNIPQILKQIFTSSMLST